jgi:gliding motility-associated-like protein
LKKQRKKILPVFFLIGFLFFSLKSFSQTLIINEVSNGESGNKEWVELLVMDTTAAYSCNPNAPPPNIDIRGWIIDDNSGYHGASGVAAGCARFSFDMMWAAVPVGTLIVIYNNADKDPSIPPDDLSMSDGNCRIIAPINNTTLFERNTTTPGAFLCSYPMTGWTAGGNWNNVVLANAGDCMRIVNTSGCEVFSVSYTAANQNTLIYFNSGTTGANNVWFFNGGNPFLQANWSEGCTNITNCGTNDQTPGLPNNLANQNFINSLNNGCSPIPALALTPQPVINAACGCNGSATVAANGSIPGYTYVWTPAPPNGQNTNTITGLCPGTSYKCVVTSHIGCKDSVTFTIGGTIAISASVTATETSCFGGSNATATASFNGGNGGINYSWSPAPGSGQGTPNAGGLSAQSYSVTVSDAAGCTSTATITPSQPTQITSTITPTAVSCFGGNNGSAAVTTSGGTGATSIVWSPGGSTSSTINNLIVGNYSVTITDANGCVVTNTVIIDQPTVITASVTSSDVLCNGASDGSATVVVNGGTSGYAYTWAPSGGNSATAGNIPAGSYTVTVTDANTCTTTATITVTEPASLIANISTTTSVSCNGGNNGSANVLVSGGTSGYSFSWLPAGGNNNLAAGLSAGNYTCTITDANGCVTTTTTSINEPTALTLSVSTQPAPCGGTGGSATVQANGATPNYSFQWSNGNLTSTSAGLATGTYTCYVTDANFCLDSIVAIVGSVSGPTVSIAASSGPACFGSNNGQITADTLGGVSPLTFIWSPSGGNQYFADSLTAGSYTITVTDANGCQNFAISNISAPTQLNTVLNLTDVLCNGGATGTASALVNGGTPNYSFSWSSGAGNSPSVSNLTVGNYTLVTTDANSCTDTVSFSISEPTPLTMSVTTVDETCNNTNGSASANVNGGVNPYTFSWSNSTLQNDTLTNISAGNFNLTVTDSNGCIINQSFSINNIGSPTVTVSSGNDITCFGQSDGSATLTASGATSLNYTWLPSGGNQSSANNLSAGTYSCIVTDLNNCSTTVTVSINEPIAINLTATSSSVLCNGASNGSATLNATGGNGGYSFVWLPTGGNNTTATGLTAGNYTCNVTDANGCIATTSVIVTQPNPISINLSATPINCINTAAIITSIVNGGTPTYTFSWSPSGTGQNPTVTSPGIYSLSISDANNCVQTQTVSVTGDLNPPQVNAGPNSSLSCLPNSTVLLSGSSSTSSVSFNWSGPNGFNASSGSPIVSVAGVYTLTVTNPQNGCSSVDTVEIFQTPGPSAAFSFTPSSGNAPLSVSFINSSMGATNYSWDFGNGNSSTNINDTSNYFNPGQYLITLFVTNAQGCIDSLVQQLIVYEEFYLSVPNVFTPNGDGSNDLFFIPSKGLASLEVLIFNRWGIQVASINAPNGYWDGKTSSGDAPDGTYFFILNAKGMDGKEHNAQGYLLLSR